MQQGHVAGKARKIALKHLHSAPLTILPLGQLRHRVKDVDSDSACSMPKRSAQGITSRAPRRFAVASHPKVDAGGGPVLYRIYCIASSGRGSRILPSVTVNRSARTS